MAPLRDAYPAGDEFILVYDVLDRVIPPGGIPLAVGAVVMNVETAMNVAHAADAAGDRKISDRRRGRGRAGDAARADRRDAGPVRGGGRRADHPDANYMVGGVMMGYLEENHDALVDKTTGGVIVLPDDHVVVRRRRQDWQQIVRIGRSACDQCSFCTELCPRWLLGHPIEPHRAMRSLGFNLVGEANVVGTQFCCECNLCSLYSCPEDLDPKNVCTQNKRRLAAEKKRLGEPAVQSRSGRSMHMANRKAPMARLMTKLGLRQFRNVGPLNDTLLPAEGWASSSSSTSARPASRWSSVGERVTQGPSRSAGPPVANGKPALGATVHASIDGAVTAIENGVVWIEEANDECTNVRMTNG